MKKILAIILLSLCCTGCYYSGINGKVVDNTTGKPIEGAVVVAQWTKPRGIPGMQYHDLHKITETLTDKNGVFFISGTSGVLIDRPEMIIYKEGYIPWRNDMVFPGGRLTKDNEWKNNVTYKLGVFTNKFTFEQLYSFLDYGIMGSGGPETPTFNDLHHKISARRTDEIEKQKLNGKTP